MEIGWQGQADKPTEHNKPAGKPSEPEEQCELAELGDQGECKAKWTSRTARIKFQIVWTMQCEPNELQKPGERV